MSSNTTGTDTSTTIQIAEFERNRRSLTNIGRTIAFAFKQGIVQQVQGGQNGRLLRGIHGGWKRDGKGIGTIGNQVGQELRFILGFVLGNGPQYHPLLLSSSSGWLPRASRCGSEGLFQVSFINGKGMIAANASNATQGLSLQGGQDGFPLSIHNF